MAEGLVLEEQRKLARRELIYYLKIVDRKTGSELGRMGDIHTAGMLVLSEKPLTVGAVYDMSLEMPKSVQADGPKEVLLECEALWTRPGPKVNNFHESGVRFLSVNEDQREAINKLIDLYAMPSQ